MFVVEILITNGTAERSGIRNLFMRFLVLVEIILSREQLMAQVTAKHLLARVRQRVPQQVLLPAEALEAVRFVALERSQPDVRLEVLHQVFLPAEHLLADVARRYAYLARTRRTARSIGIVGVRLMVTGLQVLLARQRRYGTHLLRR